MKLYIPISAALALSALAIQEPGGTVPDNCPKVSSQTPGQDRVTELDGRLPRSQSSHPNLPINLDETKTLEALIDFIDEVSPWFPDADPESTPPTANPGGTSEPAAELTDLLENGRLCIDGKLESPGATPARNTDTPPGGQLYIGSQAGRKRFWVENAGGIVLAATPRALMPAAVAELDESKRERYSQLGDCAFPAAGFLFTVNTLLHELEHVNQDADSTFAGFLAEAEVYANNVKTLCALIACAADPESGMSDEARELIEKATDLACDTIQALNEELRDHDYPMVECEQCEDNGLPPAIVEQPKPAGEDGHVGVSPDGDGSESSGSNGTDGSDFAVPVERKDANGPSSLAKERPSSTGTRRAQSYVGWDVPTRWGYFHNNDRIFNESGALSAWLHQEENYITLKFNDANRTGIDYLRVTYGPSDFVGIPTEHGPFRPVSLVATSRLSVVVGGYAEHTGEAIFAELKVQASRDGLTAIKRKPEIFFAGKAYSYPVAMAHLAGDSRVYFFDRDKQSLAVLDLDIGEISEIANAQDQPRMAGTLHMRARKYRVEGAGRGRAIHLVMGPQWISDSHWYSSGDRFSFSAADSDGDNRIDLFW